MAETRSQQEAYEYAIRKQKGLEHSKAMLTNPFVAQTTKNKSIKQQPMG